MSNLTELSHGAADQVEELASGLHERVQEQIEEFLTQQLTKLGFDFNKANYHSFEGIPKLKRVLYPDDPKTLAVYQYEGKEILAVRIGPNDMSIVFDVVDLKNGAKCD